MSKRMIDSEITDLVKYRYDSDNDETHLDFSADYTNFTGDISTEGYIGASGVSAGNVTAGSSIRGETLWLTGKGSAAKRLFKFYTGGQDKSMTGDMVANHQLYYHCVKLTGVTKTVYVNLVTEKDTAITSKLALLAAIRGDKNLTNINWYYGAGNSVVHIWYEGTTAYFKIDDEDINLNAIEDHFNGIFEEKFVANN